MFMKNALVRIVGVTAVVGLLAAFSPGIREAHADNPGSSSSELVSYVQNAFPYRVSQFTTACGSGLGGSASWTAESYKYAQVWLITAHCALPKGGETVAEWTLTNDNGEQGVQLVPLNTSAQQLDGYQIITQVEATS